MTESSATDAHGIGEGSVGSGQQLFSAQSLSLTTLCSDEDGVCTATERSIITNCVVRTRPSQQVALSDDLLPLILINLRELLKLEKGVSKWKSGFVTSLVVNRAFFHASAGILWEMLDDLATALRLLPWYKTPYTGIGVGLVQGYHKLHACGLLIVVTPRPMTMLALRIGSASASMHPISNGLRCAKPES